MRNERFYSRFFATDLYNEAAATWQLVPDDDSMFGDLETFSWLIEIVRPTELIEIGSWKGHSANFMVDKCKVLGLQPRCVCVDTFLGGPEHWTFKNAFAKLHRIGGRPTIYERFLANVLARGNQANIFPLVTDSNVGAALFRVFGFQADLIFIDGAHDPLSVRRDVLNLYPQLSPDGVMFGDDYQHEPLARTVHECARELNVPVLVKQRKWILLNNALVKRVTRFPADAQVRSSFDGWVHP